jgi:hypothetical protein
VPLRALIQWVKPYSVAEPEWRMERAADASSGSGRLVVSLKVPIHFPAPDARKPTATA